MRSFLDRLTRRRDPPLLEPQAAYARWAATYPPDAHNALMRSEQQAMEAMLHSLSPSVALDLGTGTGRYLRILQEMGTRTVVGLDLSPAMLQRARARGSSLVCGDARALPFASETFDLVSASLMVGDVDDLTGWAAEISRTLKPRGRLLYSDFHPTWTDRKWERTFRAADGQSWRLRFYPHALADHRMALARAGFEIVDVQEPSLAAGDAEAERLRALWKNPPASVVIHAAKQGPPQRGRE
jgi:malonyl-CoA O-methyltransferase